MAIDGLDAFRDLDYSIDHYESEDETNSNYVHREPNVLDELTYKGLSFIYNIVQKVFRKKTEPVTCRTIAIRGPNTPTRSVTTLVSTVTRPVFKSFDFIKESARRTREAVRKLVNNSPLSFFTGHIFMDSSSLENRSVVKWTPQVKKSKTTRKITRFVVLAMVGLVMVGIGIGLGISTLFGVQLGSVPIIITGIGVGIISSAYVLQVMSTSERRVSDYYNRLIEAGSFKIMAKAKTALSIPRHIFTSCVKPF